MLFVLILGSLRFAFSFYRLPFQNLDLNYFILLFFSIGFGSRITIQIPRFKSYFSFSDTFVFLALLIYGGEAAVLLAAVEAFVSSCQFCKKKSTVFFNAAAMSLSTITVAAILKMLGGCDATGFIEDPDSFLLVLSVIALTQFAVNTGIASIYGALKTEKPFWETWTT